MGRKGKIAGLKKIEVIEKHLLGEVSLNHIAKELDVGWATVKQWLQTYISLGPDGLLETSKNTVYTKTFKLIAIQDYLSSNASQMELDFLKKLEELERGRY